MPAIHSPALVLVTGATGYIAAWVVRSLLDAGFSVRGTARSQSKADYLINLFAKEVEAKRFEAIIVEDIALPGVFDDAVKGVDAIAHTASPFHYRADDPDELIKPAVQGTVGVLESVLKFNKDCKRIIILSSTASIVHPNAGRPLTEEDWNISSIDIVKEKGKEAPQMEKYRTSKTLAEKAAWEFYAQHKDEVGWDIVALNPPFVFGPTIHEIPNVSALNTSAVQFFDVLCKPQAGGKTDDQLISGGACRVDVRDLADAHTKAFTTERAGGERIIITAGNFTWQEMLDVAHSVAPNASNVIHIGRPGAGKDVPHPVRYANDKSKYVLGIEYRPLEDTVRDSLKDFEERGWWAPA